MDAVYIRFGYRFNFIPQCFVTNGTVNQRLHECTQTEQCKLEQALASGTPHNRGILPRNSTGTDKTHSVVPELAPRGIGRSFWTIGGSEVEVVVDVSHVETRLKDRS